MTTFIIRAVRVVDPTVSVDTIEAALAKHARGATARCRLAEELRDHPARLTRDDPRTSPVLAKVVVDLRAAGPAPSSRPPAFSIPTTSAATDSPPALSSASTTTLPSPIGSCCRRTLRRRPIQVLGVLSHLHQTHFRPPDVPRNSTQC